jgi:JmjC domain, hydroxylase
VNLALTQILRHTSTTAERLQQGNKIIKAELDLVESCYKSSNQPVCHLYLHQWLALDLNHGRSLHTLHTLPQLRSLECGQKEREETCAVPDPRIRTIHEHETILEKEVSQEAGTFEADLIRYEATAEEHATEEAGTAQPAAKIIASKVPDNRETTTSPSSPIDSIPYDEREGVIRLLPTSMEQCRDFPALLQRARQLRADSAGVFKVLVPSDLGKLCKISTKDEDRVSTFKIRKSQELPRIDRMEGKHEIRMELSHSDHIEKDYELIAHFEKLLDSRSGFRDVRYCTDLEAERPEDREQIGLPQVSPIWPAKENQLDWTKGSIPGLHSPYAYKSDKTFGAPFACHKEDGGLISANVLYFGTKIWTVAAPSEASSLETKIKASTDHKYTCAQAVRHCATYIPQSKLQDWKISHLVFPQVANEVVVVFGNAYHQGFSTGPTLAEAVNYAPTGWSIHGYSECLKSCPGYPIPNAMMEFQSDNDGQEDEDADADQSEDGLIEEEESDQVPATNQEDEEADADQPEDEPVEEEESDQVPATDQEDEEADADQSEDELVEEEQLDRAPAANQEVEDSDLEYNPTDSDAADDIPAANKRKPHKKNKGDSRNAPPKPSISDQKQSDTKKRSNSDAMLDIDSSKKRRTDSPEPDETDRDIILWKDWDNKRATECNSTTAHQIIEATSVYKRLSSTPCPRIATGNARPNISPSHYHQIVTMVLAPGNYHAFRVLKEVIQYLQQDRRDTIHRVSSTDPKILFYALDAIETSGNLDCFLRRFVLSRLAKRFRDVCRNGGKLLTESDVALPSEVVGSKKHISKAYKAMIQHIWE